MGNFREEDLPKILNNELNDKIETISNYCHSIYNYVLDKLNNSEDKDIAIRELTKKINIVHKFISGIKTYMAGKIVFIDGYFYSEYIKPINDDLEAYGFFVLSQEHIIGQKIKDIPITETISDFLSY